MKRINFLLMLMVLPMFAFSTIVVPLKVLTNPNYANGYFSWEKPEGYEMESYKVSVYENLGENGKLLFVGKTKDNYIKLPDDLIGREDILIELEGNTTDGSLIDFEGEDIPYCNECQIYTPQCYFACNGNTYAYVLELGVNQSNSNSILQLKPAFNYIDPNTGNALYYYYYMTMDNYNNNFPPSKKSPDDILYIPAQSGTYYSQTGNLLSVGVLAGIPKRLGPWTFFTNQYAELTGGTENCTTTGLSTGIGLFNTQVIQEYNDNLPPSPPNPDLSKELLECIPAPGGPISNGTGPHDTLQSYSQVLTHYWVECDKAADDIVIDDYIDDFQNWGVSLWDPCDTLFTSYNNPFENISATYIQNVNDDFERVWSSNSSIYIDENGNPTNMPGNISPGLYKYYILFNDGSTTTFYQEVKEPVNSPISYSDFVDITIYPVPLELNRHYNVKIESEASLNIKYQVYTLEGEILYDKKMKVKKGDERIYKNHKVRNEWFPYNFLVHKFIFDDGSEIIINTTVNNN